jgi:hypothetical protein
LYRVINDFNGGIVLNQVRHPDHIGTHASFLGDAEVSQNWVKHSPENIGVSQRLAVPSFEDKSLRTPIEIFLQPGDE